MGNSSSHTHEPLERGFTRGKFGDVKNGKSASFRFSKKSSSPKKMDRLRRSFRDSFRRRKDRVPESSKPHQWQADEEAVRSATCSFAVKYLGCVEVFESRGMQVCEEALKVLRNSRRRPVRGLLHVSGDGLRVVDDDTKGLIVDQTIEKVSFCAPDRNHERGFSYICRDGTTRRWMCHGFLACKDSGERLSHAVGCAFAVCLERKQRRDKECGVTMTFDVKNSTFTRSGSFRGQTLTERLANNNERGGIDAPAAVASVTPQPKPFNPFAIERPHATPSMLERQGSFRAFSTIGSQSPFKRQMSLRINDLPSNAERQKAFLVATAAGNSNGALAALNTPQRGVSPIPELSPAKSTASSSSSSAAAAAQLSDENGGILANADTVSQLCQELSQGLTLLTQSDAILGSDDLNFNNKLSINQNIIAAEKRQQIVISPGHSYGHIGGGSSSGGSIGGTPTAQVTPRVASVSPVSGGGGGGICLPSPPTTPLTRTASATPTPPPRLIAEAPLPNADQWLGQVVKSTSPALLKRAPYLSRAQTLGAPSSIAVISSGNIGEPDPFDAEWVAGVTKSPKGALQSPELVLTPPTSATAIAISGATHHSTNPFISPPKPPAQSFQVQL